VAAEKEVKNSLMFGTGYARIKKDFEKSKCSDGAQ
jgi:hypothetical protein